MLFFFPANFILFLFWFFLGILLLNLTNQFKDKHLESAYQRYSQRQRQKSLVILNIIDIVLKVIFLVAYFYAESTIYSKNESTVLQNETATHVSPNFTAAHNFGKGLIDGCYFRSIFVSFFCILGETSRRIASSEDKRTLPLSQPPTFSSDLSIESIENAKSGSFPIEMGATSMQNRRWFLRALYLLPWLLVDCLLIGLITCWKRFANDYLHIGALVTWLIFTVQGKFFVF